MSANSKGGLLAVCGAFIGLSSTTIGLRFYGRKRQGLPLGIDDWTALFGVVTFIAASALAIELVVLREDDYDTNTLTPEQAAALARPSFIMNISYDYCFTTTLACAKLSALFLYRRIFKPSRHALFNIFIIATAVTVIAWWITFNVLSLLQCPGHLSAYWDGTFEKYCYLNPVWANGLAVSDFILDLWVLLLPIPGICRLHTNLTKKLSIIGVFLLAFIGLGASIARIVIFFEADGPGRATLYIGVLEAGISITVVSLPSLYYVFVSVTPSSVVRSLHSLQSLSSKPSLDVNREPSQKFLAAEDAKGETGSPTHDRRENQHDFRRDLEHGGFQAFTRRGSGHEEMADGTSYDFPANTIKVQSDVEVRHD